MLEISVSKILQLLNDDCILNSLTLSNMRFNNDCIDLLIRLVNTSFELKHLDVSSLNIRGRLLFNLLSGIADLSLLNSLNISMIPLDGQVHDEIT